MMYDTPRLAFERTRSFTLGSMNEHAPNSTIWLITGASSGFGRALTVAALRRGEKVAGTARHLERFADLVNEYGDQFLPIEHDIRNRDVAASVVDQTIRQFGGLDVLVNNAGVGQVGTAEEVTDAQLLGMLAQHILGPAAMVRAALPTMRANGHGAIVQMSSQGGRRSFPAVGSYSAGKFALEGWSEALAGEVAPFGIRVLIVEPSRFRTGFNRSDVLQLAEENATYDAVVGNVRADMTTSDGQQEGDPARAAEIIRRVLTADNMPLRLPLGTEAAHSLATLYETQLTNTRAIAELSASADFPDASHSGRGF